MRSPQTLMMTTTPNHRGGGINHQEESSITTTKQAHLHTIVHIQVKNRSQSGAPWKTSHTRTEIQAQESPIQQLLKVFLSP